jgi:hypothetical protein
VVLPSLDVGTPHIVLEVNGAFLSKNICARLAKWRVGNWSASKLFSSVVYALTCLFTNPHPSLDMIEAVEARDVKL